VPDAHLLRRAALSAEFALAQYLVKGIAAGNQDMIDEAESMLTALAEDVAEHGGQPISVEPLPQPASVPATAATASGSAPDAAPAVQVTPIPAEAVQVTPIPAEAVQGGRDVGARAGTDDGVVDAGRTGPVGSKVSVVCVTAIPDV